MESPFPPPEATEDDEASEDDEDFDDNDDDEDGDASSSSADEMSTWNSYPLSLWQKRRVVLDMTVIILRGMVSIGDFC